MVNLMAVTMDNLMDDKTAASKVEQMDAKKVEWMDDMKVAQLEVWMVE
jgi:hypothetical protein